MDIFEIRRTNLRRWVAEHGTPSKEKSLFSQLKANGSFGERVARRLEQQYGMGDGYLDQAPDTPQSTPREAVQGDDLKRLEDDLLRRAAEMIDTYRLAGPADRERIDLVFREIRHRLATADQAKTRTR